MKLLKPGAVAPERKDAARAQPGLVCLEWGSFTDDEAARAAAALDKFALGDKVAQRKTGDSYWVYIPPLKTRADADKKVGEVKALGVTDFYVVRTTTSGSLRFRWVCSRRKRPPTIISGS